MAKKTRRPRSKKKSDYCGARNRQGKPCRNYPLSGRTRCKFHGGATTGPKTAAGKKRCSMNSVTHGVYVQGYTDDEIDRLEALMSGDQSDTLDAEIAVARIQLGRAWIQAGQAINAEDPTAGLEVYSNTASTETGGEFERRKQEVVRRRPDMWLVIDRCLSRVGRLMEQKARIIEVREVQDALKDVMGRLASTH